MVQNWNQKPLDWQKNSFRVSIKKLINVFHIKKEMQFTNMSLLTKTRLNFVKKVHFCQNG
jgi:hypothetical protein